MTDTTRPAGNDHGLTEAQHFPTTPVQCICGWRETDGQAAASWTAHFAEVLAARGADAAVTDDGLRTARREAWNQAAQLGRERGWLVALAANPYRDRPTFDNPCACGSLSLDATVSERHDRGLHDADRCTGRRDAAPAPTEDRADNVAERVRQLADEWDACDENGFPLREGSLGEAADELRAAIEDHA